jgi:hypothetical protein
LLDARLDAHINKEETSRAEAREQFGLNIFTAATYFPDRVAGEARVVNPANQFVSPAAPGIAPEREVVILKKKDTHAEMVLKIDHFFYDLLRLATADNFARRGPIEGVNRAKGTATRTAAAG